VTDRTLKLLAYAGASNFVAFLLSHLILGGDALRGKVEQGHYYLGNHGVFTQVSHTIFIYSACHAYSALLGMIAFIWAARTLKIRQRPGVSS
jgi:hypothetical protein